MISTIILLGTFVSPANAIALPLIRCFDIPETDIISTIRKALATKNLWAGLNADAVQVALVKDGSDKVYFLQVANEVYASAHIDFGHCSESASVTYVQKTSKFGSIPNHVYTYVFPGNMDFEAASTVASNSKHPVIVFNISLPPTFPGMDSNMIARVLLHESFHMGYQFFGGFDLKTIQAHPRDFYTECIKDVGWKSAHEAEMAVVNEIRRSWNDITNDEIIDAGKKISAIRRSLPDSSIGFDCFQHANAWERIEGTAHFIDIETALGLGQYSKILYGDLSEGETDSYFYKTGATYCLILERLFGKFQWQKMIDVGASPFEVLTQLGKF
jgi:hypothetical protein